MINVAVVEDNDTIREGLRILINETEGYSCNAAYPNSDLLLKRINGINLNVLLLDIPSDVNSAVGIIQKIKFVLPDLVIIILTLYEERDFIFDAICAGASGYIVKRIPSERLFESIQEAYYGGIPMSSEIARKAAGFFKKINPAGESISLSISEENILNKIIEGNSFKAITDSLSIGIEDIRLSFRNIYKKLHLQAQMKENK